MLEDSIQWSIRWAPSSASSIPHNRLKRSRIGRGVPFGKGPTPPVERETLKDVASHNRGACLQKKHKLQGVSVKNCFDLPKPCKG